ncbi:hypothetical protein B484DRAFT_453193 [Ochromonadaceae sp. CCMP2298]|nr:hypothetical protein B484DRAFT_453193 [Ochromonadaceae sp. CCMP2298]|mmetsp:Transcript_22400/g.48532  ORF Transcript_22400/g.48532 Transcript_22400/m.48532 type:complete len:238 (-) Transcript_22400:271-984(-)
MIACFLHNSFTTAQSLSGSMSSFAIDDAVMANLLQKMNKIATEVNKVNENSKLKKPVMELSRVLLQILEHQVLTPEMRAKSNALHISFPLALHVRGNILKAPREELRPRARLVSEESSMSEIDGWSSEAGAGIGSIKTGVGSIKTPQEGLNVTPTPAPHDEMTTHCRVCGQGNNSCGCDLCTNCGLAVPRGVDYCGCQGIRLSASSPSKTSPEQPKRARSPSDLIAYEDLEEYWDLY